MNTYYLAFYKGKKANPHATLLDRIICTATDSEYSHVELILEPDGYSVSASPRDGGVRFVTIDYHPEQWEIIPVHIDLSLHQLRYWFYPELTKKYDFLGAIGTVIPFIPENHDRWFCSEILSYLLIQHGNLKIDKAPKKISPELLYRYAKS